MSKFPWKSAVAGAAILAGTLYVFAAPLTPGTDGPMCQHGGMMDRMSQMHREMMQGQGGMHGGMGQHGAMHEQQAGATETPTLPGQGAFGAIQEVVEILQANPATDWSKVNIAVLRDHLIDMNEVTLNAAANERTIDNGVEVDVTGEGRTLAAIKRMVPAHVRELARLGWKASTQDLPNGVRLTVLATDTQPLAMLKALGFMGIMVQGGHHQPHHLMMAKGEMQY